MDTQELKMTLEFYHFNILVGVISSEAVLQAERELPIRPQPAS
jgi:hypothetical protein